MLRFITDREIYSEVIQVRIPAADRYVWIGTSDIKDMYVKSGPGMAPFLQTLSELIDKGVLIRLIHAKEPGPNFRKDFDRYPNLYGGLERMLCPRVHFKCVIIDGKFAYTGSANLTGAGMGAKSVKRRNFESGIITDEKLLVSQIAGQFDNVWIGSYCSSCGRRKYCSDCPIERL
jgi:phosphatidylserine/phosphatidylglycerophosphate/cardiolipin synthase-like enzyme